MYYCIACLACVHVGLRFAVGVGSSGACMLHVLILMFILSKSAMPRTKDNTNNINSLEKKKTT